MKYLYFHPVKSLSIRRVKIFICRQVEKLTFTDNLQVRFFYDFMQLYSVKHSLIFVLLPYESIVRLVRSVWKEIENMTWKSSRQFCMWRNRIFFSSFLLDASNWKCFHRAKVQILMNVLRYLFARNLESFFTDNRQCRFQLCQWSVNKYFNDFGQLCTVKHSLMFAFASWRNTLNNIIHKSNCKYYTFVVWLI